MSDISTPAGPVMSPSEAARYTGVAVSTLAKMRCWGGGPEFLKLGRKVAYEQKPLDDWKNQRRARNTSDADRLPRRLTDERKTAAASAAA
jgi:hypothetical protein